jgi:hypothetical protein
LVRRPLSFIWSPDQKRSGHHRLSGRRIQTRPNPLESYPDSKPVRPVHGPFCEEDLSYEISWSKVQEIFEWIVSAQYYHFNLSYSVYHPLFMMYLSYQVCPYSTGNTKSALISVVISCGRARRYLARSGGPHRAPPTLGAESRYIITCSVVFRALEDQGTRREAQRLIKGSRGALTYLYCFMSEHSPILEIDVV